MRAPALIDHISRYDSIADPFWRLCCETVLMFCHRLSKEIDIFVPDPQHLGVVPPRLSDRAADLTQDYTEQPGTFLKLQFEEGDVDFVGCSQCSERRLGHLKYRWVRSESRDCRLIHCKEDVPPWRSGQGVGSF